MRAFVKALSVSMLAALVMLGCARGSGGSQTEEPVEKFSDIKLIPLEQLCITVIYDNTAYFQELQADWGFSCVVDAVDEKILFDTGARGDYFMVNLDKIANHPRDIRKVFLSHEHWDHTGGLDDFLVVNSDVDVYLLKSFPGALKKTVRDASAGMVEIKAPQKIADGIYSTGTMGKRPDEQAMIITTDQGAVVITGCAHPGIVEIVKRAKELTGQKILLVMGGFHLKGEPEETIQGIIDEFQEMGVLYVGPCHCTGTKEIEQFRQAFGHRCLDIGVGREITGVDFIIPQD